MFFVFTPGIIPGPEGGVLEEINPERFDAMAAVGGAFPWPAGEKRRFDEGHRLFAWCREGTPRCFGWITDCSSFPLGELGRTGIFGPSRLIWDCVTPAPERGKGYYAGMLRAMLAGAPGTRFVIYCTEENTPSWRGILKAGFRPWVRARVYRVGSSVKLLDRSLGPFRLEPIP